MTESISRASRPKSNKWSENGQDTGRRKEIAGTTGTEKSERSGERKEGRPGLTRSGGKRSGRGSAQSARHGGLGGNSKKANPIVELRSEKWNLRGDTKATPISMRGRS